MVFESSDMLSKKQADNFIKWFSDKIGTDFELNPSASGEPDEYYIMFFDLETNAEWYAVNAKNQEYVDFNNKMDGLKEVYSKYPTYKQACERIQEQDVYIKMITGSVNRVCDGLGIDLE